MASLRARTLRWITSRYIKKVDTETADPKDLRQKLISVSRLLRRLRGVTVEATEVNGLYAEWLRPKNAREGRVLLYLHGGAYVMGSCQTHRNLASNIARAAQMNALVPEYRLAPENRFPAAIDDVVAVYRHLLTEGFEPENICIAGDSAGGGLTVAMLLSLRHAGDPMPARAVLLSPFLDVTASGESMQSRADKDPWFQPHDIAVVARQYCNDESEHRNPLVSPVFANVAGLPPTYIQVGDDEILLSDSTRFADLLEAAGGDVEIEVCPDMWHVFQLFVGKMPEARAAVNRIGAYLGGNRAEPEVPEEPEAPEAPEATEASEASEA